MVVILRFSPTSDSLRPSCRCRTALVLSSYFGILAESPTVTRRQREGGTRGGLVSGFGEAAVFGVGVFGDVEELGGEAGGPAVGELGVEANGAADGEAPGGVGGFAGETRGDAAEVDVVVKGFLMDDAEGGAGEDGEAALGVDRQAVAVVEEDGDLFGLGVAVDDAGDDLVVALPLGVAGAQAELVAGVDAHAEGQAGAELVAVGRPGRSLELVAGVGIGGLSRRERFDGGGVDRRREAGQHNDDAGTRRKLGKDVLNRDRLVFHEWRRTRGSTLFFDWE